MTLVAIAPAIIILLVISAVFSAAETAMTGASTFVLKLSRIMARISW